jgi:hypothetical protein
MTAIADTASTITVLVPIAIRRRNGRPKIMLPHDGARHPDASDPASGAVVRAIARAGDWRRRLEAGEVDTLRDIADAEKITVPFVSRFIRLAYLSPAVLDRIVAEREGVAVSLEDLPVAALDLWAVQPARILDRAGCGSDKRDGS